MSNFSTFVIEYLSKIKTEFENTLAVYQGLRRIRIMKKGVKIPLSKHKYTKMLHLPYEISQHVISLNILISKTFIFSWTFLPFLLRSSSLYCSSRFTRPINSFCFTVKKKHLYFWVQNVHLPSSCDRIQNIFSSDRIRNIFWPWSRSGQSALLPAGNTTCRRSTLLRTGAETQ